MNLMFTKSCTAKGLLSPPSWLVVPKSASPSQKANGPMKLQHAVTRKREAGSWCFSLVVFGLTPCKLCISSGAMCDPHRRTQSDIHTTMFLVTVELVPGFCCLLEKFYITDLFLLTKASQNAAGFHSMPTKVHRLC